MTEPTPSETLAAAYQQVAEIEADMLEEIKLKADAFLAEINAIIGESATGLPSTPAKAYFIRAKTSLNQTLNVDLTSVLTQYGLVQQPGP